MTVSKKLVNSIKKDIKILLEGDYTCCHHVLNDKLAIFVGWEPGYDDDVNDGDIHAKDNPTYCMNIGLGVYTSSYMLSDMEDINQPYYDNGDVWDTHITIQANYTDESIKSDLEWLLKQYEAMSKLEMDDSGLILEKN